MSQFFLKSLSTFRTLFLQKLSQIIVILVITFSLFSCSFFAKADTQSDIEIDPKLEQQVLQIIRNNPEAIIQSVQDYQESQRQQQQQQRQSLLEKMKNEPQSFIGESPVFGAKSAKIVMFEFSDFQCPFCGRASGTIKQFMDKHKNEVRLVFKHFPLAQIHPNAIPASKASWAAMKQGKFWEYHDQLFANQNRLGDDLYLEIAQTLNLNVDKFNSDRQSEEAQKAVNSDLDLAMQLELSGTPTFVMNGELFSGALDLADFEQKLAQAQQ